MIEPILNNHLEPVIGRMRRYYFWRNLAVCWSGIFVAGVLAAMAERMLSTRILMAVPILVASAAAAVWMWRRAQQWKPDLRVLAREIETRDPELHGLLLTAVEQEPDSETGRLNFLQERVVQDAVKKAVAHQSWTELVSTGRLMTLYSVNALLAVLLLSSMFYFKAAPSEKIRRIMNFADGGVSVTPGDSMLEKGESLVVWARFNTPLPHEAMLVTRDGSGKEQRTSLAKNLQDPVFGGSVMDVEQDLFYRVEYNGKRTKEFKVSVFEHPRLERADADLRYPAYTKIPEKRIEDTHRISAMEGTKLDLSLQLNKPVVSAQLISRDKGKTAAAQPEILNLVPQPGKAVATLKDFELSESKTYELVLKDAEGRTNKLSAQFVIDVLKNKQPELKISSPRGDTRVSAIEEIAFNAEAWDDVGLLNYGLSYTTPDGKTTELKLSQGPTGPKEKKQFSHMMKLEDVGVKPDQMISYFVWADDIGPDGQIRRTSSDMFFAEVRPFDEIFRQGQGMGGQQQQQQQQGGQGQGSPSVKLAELQKQIINATWKLQRTSGAGAKTAAAKTQYTNDVSVVSDSQQQALEQVEELKGRAANDPQRLSSINTAEKEMKSALTHLEKAMNGPKPLPEAVSSEQAAYQAILRVQAREFEVSRAQRGQQGGGGGGGGGGQPNQSQLDELDVASNDNRYEQQRQALPNQNPAQREKVQMGNRLKELAQRQQDLNGRLRELQTALQEAKTEQQRQDLQRELKRLREEEREMLADVDKMRQQMDQSQNQAALAESRKQLDQTRDEMQQASQALDQNAVPQALTAGTRAQRDLQQVRDDLRKSTSNQFAEDARNLREQAQELARREEDIAKKLNQNTDPRQKTLSDSVDKEAVASQLDEQRKRLTNLLEHATEITQQAEETEPLFSKQLYDTIRKASIDEGKNLSELQDDLLRNRQLTVSVNDLLTRSKKSERKALDVTSDLLRRGDLTEATNLEQRARASINDIRRGVERAAENVLGDETEALRLAKKELDELGQQLEQKMNQAASSNRLAQASGSTNNLAMNGQRQPGQQGQRGQDQRGQGQQGQRGQQGQGQEGQSQQGQGGQQPGEGENGQPSQNGQQGQGRANGQQPGQQGQRGQGQQGRGQGQGQQGQGQGEGQQPGDQSGQVAQNGQQGQGRGNGQQPGQQGQRGQGQRGQGQQGQGQGQGDGQQPGQDQAGQVAQNGGRGQRGRGGRNGGRNNANTEQQAGGATFLNGENFGGNNNNTGGTGGMTGIEFQRWRERLSNVEEMIPESRTRGELTRVREQAQALRLEIVDLKKPNWTEIKTKVLDPLVEVRNQVADELARRESSDSLAPIDRDPVPAKYSEVVRKYYENLGKSE